MKLKIENETKYRQKKIENVTKYRQKTVRISYVCGCKWVSVCGCKSFKYKFTNQILIHPHQLAVMIFSSISTVN